MLKYILAMVHVSSSTKKENQSLRLFINWSITNLILIWLLYYSACGTPCTQLSSPINPPPGNNLGIVGFFGLTLGELAYLCIPAGLVIFMSLIIYEGYISKQAALKSFAHKLSEDPLKSQTKAKNVNKTETECHQQHPAQHFEIAKEPEGNCQSKPLGYNRLKTFLRSNLARKIFWYCFGVS